MAESDELDPPRACWNARSVLNERERHILTERRLKEEPVTLEDLSAEFGVSRERVRQIEVRAFEKLQKKRMHSWHGRRERNTVNSSRPSRSRDSV
jgi:RNA polymerase sigma-32 factor